MSSFDSATRLVLLLLLASATACGGSDGEQAVDGEDAATGHDTAVGADGASEASSDALPSDVATNDTSSGDGAQGDTALTSDGSLGDSTPPTDAAADVVVDTAPVDSGPCIASCTDTVRTTTTSMSQVRSGHASVTLADGKVMVFDGLDTGAAGPRYELFDPATETWSVPTMTNAPTLPGDVAYLRAAGDVVTGHTAFDSKLSFYTPATGAWKDSPYPSLLTTDPFSTVLPTGHGVVGGGYTTGGYTRAGLYGYDPVANTWKSGSLNEPRRSALAAPAGALALVVGGRNGLSDLFSAELVEPVTAVSRFTGSPRDWFFDAQFVSLANGDVLMVGGDDSTRGAMPNVERWSIATGKWSSVEPLGTARLQTALVTLKDGRVLAIGGRSKTFVPVPSIEAFDPATGKWQTIGTLGRARYGAAATVLPDGRVVVSGGTAASAIELSSVEIIDPTKPCAAPGAVVCACVAETDQVLCERHESTCATHALVDRCGKTRTVTCAADTCSTTDEVCSITGNASRCVWKSPAGARFRVEPFGFSNYFQRAVAIGGDALDRPLMVVQGTAYGTNFDAAVALHGRLPTGRWVLEGLTTSGSSTPRSSSAYYDGRAPRVLVTRSGSEALSLHKWITNAWHVTTLNGLYATRMSGRALVTDASDNASIAWVRQPFSGTAYDVGFTVAEPAVTTSAVDTITGGSDMGAALDASGTPHLAYVDSVTGVKYATRSGTAWTKEVVDAIGGSRTNVFVDGAGVVHLVWQGKAGANVVKHAVRTTGAWVVDEWTLPQSDASGVLYGVSSDGKVHVAWYSKTANAILYAVRGASSWTTDTVYQPSGPTDSLSMSAFSMAKDGKPRLAFNLGGSIYYATTP